MSSTEIIILAVGGITASLLYISRHIITSKCWSKDECCTMNLRKNSQSRLSVAEPAVASIVAEPVEPKPAVVSSVV